MSDFDLQLQELVTDILNTDTEVQEDTRLDTLENWDSFNSLRLLVQIEQNFQVRIKLEDFHKLLTVGELGNIILSQQSGKTIGVE
ncbi:acyl carrier protein [Paenibacillus polymyxa]|uniref:acyl carrier protein n=1 Tax=Paenibacillus polymyxa TaxID=1406 RepID=UPI002794C7B3|nr:acyl carrier protein [Paenibacillus polymyxa]MDQ0045770.1 acyl carrier protein [Paenibacillus polymyxa]